MFGIHILLFHKASNDDNLQPDIGDQEPRI